MSRLPVGNTLAVARRVRENCPSNQTQTRAKTSNKHTKSTRAGRRSARVTWRARERGESAIKHRRCRRLARSGSLSARVERHTRQTKCKRAKQISKHGQSTRKNTHKHLFTFRSLCCSSVGSFLHSPRERDRQIDGERQEEKSAARRSLTNSSARLTKKGKW